MINGYQEKIDCGNLDIVLVLCLELADSYPSQGQRATETEMIVAAMCSFRYISNLTFTSLAKRLSVLCGVVAATLRKIILNT